MSTTFANGSVVFDLYTPDTDLNFETLIDSLVAEWQLQPEFLHPVDDPELLDYIETEELKSLPARRDDERRLLVSFDEFTEAQQRRQQALDANLPMIVDDYAMVCRQLESLARRSHARVGRALVWSQVQGNLAMLGCSLRDVRAMALLEWINDLAIGTDGGPLSEEEVDRQLVVPMDGTDPLRELMRAKETLFPTRLSQLSEEEIAQRVRSYSLEHRDGLWLLDACTPDKTCWAPRRSREMLETLMALETFSR